MISRRAFTRPEILLVATMTMLLVAVVFRFFAAADGRSHSATCQSNLKQIGLAFTQYRGEYDEKFPLVAVNAVSRSYKENGFERWTEYGWADALAPYVLGLHVFHCPAQGDDGQNNPTQDEYTDYWMNSRLSSFSYGQIRDPFKTVLAGEGNAGEGGTNARYSKSGVPMSWADDRNSPANRHRERMNILFADGHVKALRAKRFAPPR